MSAARSITGTSHPDVIVVGRRSGATVHGRGGDDLICGGAGRDTLYGDDGDDRMSGGRGRDRMNGGSGLDAFSATPGDVTDVVAGERVNGRSRSIISHARKGTIELRSRDVVSVEAGPRGRSVLVMAGTAGIPRPGSVISSPISDVAPVGVLGRVVVARRQAGGRVRVTLASASLTDAYSDYSVRLHGSLGTAAASGPRAQASALGGTFDCTSGSGIGPTVEVHLDLSKLHYIVELQTLNPYIEFFVTGQPQLSLNLAFHGRVTCAARRSLPVMVPLPGTPLTMNVRPEFSFTVGAALAANATWSPHIAYGFIRSRQQGNSDFHVFTNGGSVGFVGEGSLEAFMGMNMELALAGQVGVGGTIGPVLTGRVQALPQHCFTVDAALRGQLTASARVFFKDWQFALATLTFGKLELFRHCASGGAVPNLPGPNETRPGSGGGTPPGPGAPASVVHHSAEGPYTGPPPEPSQSESPLASVGYDFGCAIGVARSVRCFGGLPFDNIENPTGVFTQVSVGSMACGVRENQTLACWGPRDGVEVPPAGRFLSVSVGLLHACAIDVQYIATCWGRNESGQAQPHPGRYTQVSAGWDYSCGIRTDGTVDCWGNGGLSVGDAVPPPDGVFGQVSVGEDEACGLRYLNTVTCWDVHGGLRTRSGPFTGIDVGPGWACGHQPNDELSCFGPTGGYNGNLAGTSRPGTFRQIGIGRIGACGRRDDGAMTCWGERYAGQVAPATGSFTEIAAGNYFTCGLTAAGAPSCWGGRDGESPVQLSGSFRQLSGGGRLSGSNLCGLRTDDTLDCAGGSPLAGTFASLAVTESEGCAAALGSGAVSCWSTGVNLAPVPPAGRFGQLSATSYGGSTRYCGLHADRTIACWGQPALAADPPGGEFLKVEAGEITSCGIRVDSTLECWKPPSWDGPPYPPSGTFRDVAVGRFFACAVRTDGSLTCWGEGRFGETAPPAGTFVQIVAGEHHACARRADGTVACWGDGEVLPAG